MTDREKVIEALQYMISEDCTETQFDYINDIEAAISLLKEQNNCENCAIAIEDRQLVVRCDDCTYLNADTGICIVGIPHGNKDTFYCAYGKRRQSGNDT